MFNSIALSKSKLRYFYAYFLRSKEATDKIFRVKKKVSKSKVKKFNKIGQDLKSLISAFAYYLTATAKA